ncbi:MAG: HlyD family type I secretion periplasmic adaptor subunit [Phyllobacteriaceae bacterium]|nr:HlyD family type I secretion periplasmic adaptor subunit [Phyllobacteriaceae bacterium]
MFKYVDNLRGCGLVLGSVGAWAGFSHIQGAVIAPGHIVVESRSKRVQHPAGGVVTSISVRNGDYVKAGNTLLTLDVTDVKAELEIIEAAYYEILAKVARLNAQKDGKRNISFDRQLLQLADQPGIAMMMKAQVQLLESNLDTLEGRKDQLSRQIEQLSQVNKGLEAQLEGISEQHSLLESELSDLKVLQQKGLVERTNVFRVMREIAGIKSESGHIGSEISRTKVRISETELKRYELEDQALFDTISELREAEAKLKELAERKNAAAVRLARTTIRAPQTGYVHDLAVSTVGGVIASGETIMMIVPAKDHFLVEARVRPQDIDQVEQDQAVLLRFANADSRLTPQIKGKVTGISPDLHQDEGTGMSYYIVKFQPEENYTDALGSLLLKPGMPVEAFIQTASRTPLAYLVQPLSDQLNRAFREK